MYTIAERVALQRRYLAQVRQRMLAARAQPAVFFCPRALTKVTLSRILVANATEVCRQGANRLSGGTPEHAGAGGGPTVC